MKLKITIFFLFLLLSQASEATLSCPKTFEAAIDQQLRSIDERDLDTYMSTVPADQDQLVILPDGNTWASRDEIEQGHKEWFKDTSWVFSRELIRKDVRDTWALVVYRVSVDRPNAPGKPFLLSMLFAPEVNGCWYLQHDQNTLLSDK